MHLAQAELRRIHLPLVTPFRTSFGTESTRDILLIRVTTEDGTEGWGECVATNLPLYSSEYVAGAQHVIREFLLPRLHALPDVTAHRIAPAHRNCPNWTSST